MIGRWLRGDRDERAIQDPGWSTWAAGGDLGTGNTNAGQHVTQESSLRLLSVYGATSFIANTIGALPIDVYREQGDVKTELRVPRFITSPNNETDRVTFVVQAVMSLLLDGNAYLVPVRDARGAVIEMHLLHPSWVSIMRPSPGAPRVYHINTIAYRGELIHIPWIMLPGGLKGLSPIEQARQSIGLGLGALEHGARLFGQGTTLSGIIKVQGELTDDAAKSLRNNWVKQHGGASKASLPGVLTGGAEWQSIQMTNEQAQFLDTRKFTAAEICAQLYHLDPSWMGIGIEGKNMTYENLEARGIHLVQFTLMPLIVRLEQALTSLLPAPQFAKFCVEALQRGDIKSRYEAYQLGLGANGGVPFLDVPYVRDLEDLPPEFEPPEVPDTTPPVVAG